MSEFYFKILSIVLGTIMILKLPLVHIYPEKWNQFELGVAYTKEKPKWVWIVGIIGILIIIITWYLYLNSQVKYSFIPTLTVTITLIKIFQLLFRYQKFRNFAQDVTEKNRHILLMLNLVTFCFGIILLYVGIVLI